MPKQEDGRDDEQQYGDHSIKGFRFEAGRPPSLAEQFEILAA
jgi:hypothetical protein